MSVTVIVCCRTHLYAEGVSRLLEDDDEFRLLGIACDDDEINNLVKYNPDVVVSDLESCRKVLDLLPSGEDKKVLLIDDSDELSSDKLKGMIADGLGGILAKDSNGQSLRKATHKLHEGELWIDHQTVREVLSRKEDKKKEIHLTKKEVEILNYICVGLSNKEIATKLFISEQTVKSHCNHLFKKFGVSSRLKLAIRAPQCYPETLKGSSLVQ